MIDYIIRCMIFLTPIFAFAASLMALLAVHNWKKNYLAQRKIQVCEEALEIFYKASDSIDIIFSNAISKLDHMKRRGGVDDLEYLQKYLPGAISDLLSDVKRLDTIYFDINKIQYRYMSVYGRRASDTFDCFHKATACIIVKTRNLEQMLFFYQSSLSFQDSAENIRKTFEQYADFCSEDDTLGGRSADLTKMVESELEKVNSSNYQNKIVKNLRAFYAWVNNEITGQ